MTYEALRDDKERMDEIAEKLSRKTDARQDRYLYWMAVAIGHLLEWAVTRKK